MGQLQAHGLTVSPPAGWEGRIFRRPTADELHGASTGGAVEGAPAPAGELVHPVVHVATIPLPPDVADFASDAVSALGPTDAIVVLKEFDPSEAGFALFRTQGVPGGLDPDRFDPSSLQRTLPGQAGLQLFFQDNGRAFCLYVVLGSFARRNDVVPAVNDVLATIRIDPLGSTPTTTTGPTTGSTTTTTTTSPPTAGSAPATGPTPTTGGPGPTTTAPPAPPTSPPPSPTPSPPPAGP